ncbi:adenylyltransferase/cytidyltransferase family protein [Candidatus Nanohalovita haloferacivicina]|uniref:adenylyltransferase/cytidyltransferase family protein n=1 Tax=Candidatus Nanohalovita haloferacivicina TaxID=2978046 RepID=UPI00325FDB0B|nr:FAD synthetase [Candidatus Nanohalobia archaeon BNXNv]
MTTVMAQGTFDILHPGHLHYLQKSAQLGDKLVVIISRDSRVKEKKGLHFNEEERREMVQALKPVDQAVLGSEGDIYTTVKETDPDIITLGYDQKHDEKEVQKMAEKATGHKVQVKRISGLENYSSSNIRN